MIINKTDVRDVWQFLGVKWLKRGSEAKLRLWYIHAFMCRVVYKPEILTKISKGHSGDISTLNGMASTIMARKVHALSTENGKWMEDNDTNQEIIHLYGSTQNWQRKVIK